MLQGFRFLTFVLGIAAMAASGPLMAQRAQGYVQEVQGNVTGQVGAGQPARVAKGLTVPNNATVTTGDQSYAVLKFEDGTAVLLKENTAFQVQSYSYNPKAPENSSAIFNLVRGGLRMVTGLVTSRNRDALKVGTPLATIGIRGTEFVAELVNPLFIQVVNGVITVTNAAGTVVFSAGQAAVVANPSTLAGIVPLNQVPPGVLQMPNFPLTPVPETIPPGASVGGGVAGAGTTTAIAIGVAVGAAAAISASDQSSTVVHH
jgi:hypothetical protein